MSDDFRLLLDQRFGRVDDALSGIRETLARQDVDRGRQFAMLELKHDTLEAKVDKSDGRLKIVGGISAGVGGVFGAILTWVADHWLGVDR